MKITQCKYNHSGTEISVSIYFDLKAFEFILPPMSKDEEDKFIRLVCDSLAAAIGKENTGKQFFIKKIFRNIQNNTLKILCTDGFLVDSSLIISVTQQAFSEERIKISDAEQLPTRFRLNNEVSKNINDKLLQFEEEARKQMPAYKANSVKEAMKHERPKLVMREYAQDKMIDVITEINHAKKEVNDLALSNNKMFSQLMEKISSGGNQIKSNDSLKQKIEETKNIPAKFIDETSQILQNITQQTDAFTIFKYCVITTLYEAAIEVKEALSKTLKNASPLERKTLITEYNRKFSNIIMMSSSGELTTLDDAKDALQKLTLEDLQAIISKEDKVNPGLLQKCNTSWTEESIELQIVMKNISQLNRKLSQLFANNSQFPLYAHKDMVQITRIPFPRSFQFRFSENAFHYKKSVDDFCRTQKDIILNLAKKYIQLLQSEETREQIQSKEVTPQEMLEINKPAPDFKDLLKRKEDSGKIIASANQENKLTSQHLQAALKSQAEMISKIDPNLTLITNKISDHVRAIQNKVEAANKLLQQMNDLNSQIDATIGNTIDHPEHKFNLSDVDDKITSLNTYLHDLVETNATIKDLNDKFSNYESAVKLSEKMSQSDLLIDMIELRNQAKTTLLEFFKNKAETSESKKNEMIALYTDIDSSMFDIDKMNHDLSLFKSQLFSELNTKNDATIDDFSKKLQPIKEKLEAIDAAKNTIHDKILNLKNLSLETAHDK